MADEEQTSGLDVATGVTDVAGTVYDIFSGLNSREKCLIEAHNDTGYLLKRLSDAHSSGGFASLPEDEVEAGAKDTYISHDTGIFRGAVGELTYGVFADADAAEPMGRWTIRWSIPQVGDPECSHVLTGLDPALFVARSRIGGGKETEAKFELEGPGGGKKKGGAKPAGPDLKSTVLIEVRNHTDQPLTLVDQGHDHGGFVTTPVATIAPGAVDSFASYETDRSEKQGSQGFLKYAIGGTRTEWTVRWHNPESADNTSESVLDGAEADQFVGLDQIGAGEENVPVVFTLSRGGGGGGQQVARNTVEVTILNQSTQLLTLLDSAPFAGEFVTAPPTELAAGASATFSCAEAEGAEETGCQGFVRYHNGDAAAFLWTMVWNNPESGENTATVTVDGADAQHFTTDGEITQDKASAAATFTLAGGPAHTEPEYVPPVEQDEPTLRYGDNSVDGWVEYLQELLNSNGFGPLGVDGVFGPAVLAAVRAFQTRRRDEAGGPLMVDGIVGHQTWAALREESPREPSTDGRTPHTYVEEGPEARFYTEDSAVSYAQSTDNLMLIAVNTGNEVIRPGQFEAHARITFPGGEVHNFVVPVSPTAGDSRPGEYLLFEGPVEHAIEVPLPAGIHKLEAYLPEALGGDQTEENLTVE